MGCLALTKLPEARYAVGLLALSLRRGNREADIFLSCPNLLRMSFFPVDHFSKSARSYLTLFGRNEFKKKKKRARSSRSSGGWPENAAAPALAGSHEVGDFFRDRGEVPRGDLTAGMATRVTAGTAEIAFAPGNGLVVPRPAVLLKRQRLTF